jgi:hypothetical protein
VPRHLKDVCLQALQGLNQLHRDSCFVLPTLETRDAKIVSKETRADYLCPSHKEFEAGDLRQQRFHLKQIAPKDVS